MNPNYNNPAPPSEFLEKVIQIKRVSKKTKGGNQISFTALTVAGDRVSRVGIGHARAKNVADAIKKSLSKARKNMITLQLVNQTISGSVVSGGGSGADAGGGSGSGGSIFLRGSSVTLGTNKVTATGGTGGYDGGSGRIAVYYVNAPTGTTNPAAYTQSFTVDAGDPATYYSAFYLGSTNTDAQDVAEYYPISDSSLVSGELVSLDSSGLLQRAKNTDKALLGVISTNPGVVLGDNDYEPDKQNQRLVALAGRVPVKVNNHNGSIQPGDLITISDIPGQGQKLVQSGWYLGKALQSFSQDQGIIQVFISSGYFEETSTLVSRVKGLLGGETFFNNLFIKNLKTEKLQLKSLKLNGQCLSYENGELIFNQNRCDVE